MACTHAVFECCLDVSFVSHELISDSRLYSCAIEKHLTWRVLYVYIYVYALQHTATHCNTRAIEEHLTCRVLTQYLNVVCMSLL